MELYFPYVMWSLWWNPEFWFTLYEANNPER